MMAAYGKYGLLNYLDLVKDGLIHIRKDKAKQILANITIRQGLEDNTNKWLIQLGQHIVQDNTKKLQGIGRKIRIWSYSKEPLTYKRLSIWEGQFKNNEMNGFGRWIKVWNQESSYYIGNWHRGKFHGYGKMKYYNGKVKEGLWESGNFRPGQKSDIRIGRAIKFDDYIARADENLAD